ncbi:unnamed protein product [Cochlearia groenlandica]
MGCCRDIMLTFSIALLLISLLQILLFHEGQQVKELSEVNQFVKDRNTLGSKNKKIDDDDVQERLIQRYFKGRSFGLNHTIFEDSYRKIPSAPDPLHN